MIREYLKNVLKEVALDIVIFAFREGRMEVLLLKWKHTDKYSLPGGRIRVDESLKDAVARTVEERTGLKGVFLQQFQVFGELDRYSYYSAKQTREYVERALGESLEDLDLLSRTVSIGYYALVNGERALPQPDALTEACAWWDVHDLPRLLFDHNHMIERALETLRREIRYQPVGQLLPEKFTLGELHRLFEVILGIALDRRNFHKIVTGYDFLIRLNEKKVGAAIRAPQLYSFNFKKYYAALKDGVGV